MRFIILGLLACSTGDVQQPEPLNLPRQVEEMLAHGIEILPWEPRPEHGKQTVWQLYSIDASGRFRPRVNMSPQGTYYLHNGAPFPWSTVGATHYRPFVSP